MIDNLRGTTQRNYEQDWLKTKLARFTGMLQGQRDLITVSKMLLSELAPLVNIQQGAVYQMQSVEPGDVVTAPSLRLLAGYAMRDDQPLRIELGRGLVGQCAVEKQSILLKDVPTDYIVQSSLGGAPPAHVVVLPVPFEGETKAVIELARLAPLTPPHLPFLVQSAQAYGDVLSCIVAARPPGN